MLSTNLKLNLVLMNKDVQTGASSGVRLIQSNLAVGSHFSFFHVILIFCVFFFSLPCRPMPDIETLMQEWSPEFEELLGKV